MHSDNFRAISLLAISATILARIFNIRTLEFLSSLLFIVITRDAYSEFILLIQFN